MIISICNTNKNSNILAMGFPSPEAIENNFRLPIYYTHIKYYMLYIMCMPLHGVVYIARSFSAGIVRNGAPVHKINVCVCEREENNEIATDIN